MNDNMDKRENASHFLYHILAFFARICLRICHPVIRISGRENLPTGAAVLCANHSSFSDPVWILAWSRLSRLPRTMAKKELFRNPVFRWVFSLIGAFPVDREKADITAIKTAMHTLKDNNKLLIFPEGTRIRKGKTSQPHSGAVLIAHRMKAPIVPVYLSVQKGLFRPIRLVFGTPYMVDFGGEKPDSAALDQSAVVMMDKIYSMGQQKRISS